MTLIILFVEKSYTKFFFLLIHKDIQMSNDFQVKSRGNRLLSCNLKTDWKMDVYKNFYWVSDLFATLDSLFKQQPRLCAIKNRKD